ncbi:hypothetical protein BD310DRAFT_925950 [Dichomitus squalens]|uniref:Uncharacterized protein n=1 Tax=Dichomitus squalens TaxID=114155 RepID=A0A4Q9PWY5_9APHY|nr:hypothetical protein BD310DRAFT_925950 [Dichomitus squalens]
MDSSAPRCCLLIPAYAPDVTRARRYTPGYGPLIVFLLITDRRRHRRHTSQLTIPPPVTPPVALPMTNPRSSLVCPFAVAVCCDTRTRPPPICTTTRIMHHHHSAFAFIFVSPSPCRRPIDDDDDVVAYSYTAALTSTCNQRTIVLYTKASLHSSFTAPFSPQVVHQVTFCITVLVRKSSLPFPPFACTPRLSITSNAPPPPMSNLAHPSMFVM